MTVQLSPILKESSEVKKKTTNIYVNFPQNAVSNQIININLVCLNCYCNHRLESLCINGCNAVSNDGLETLIKKHGTQLRVLEMFGCFNLSPRGLRSIANSCVNLISLNLGQCYKVYCQCWLVLVCFRNYCFIDRNRITEIVLDFRLGKKY